MPIGMSLHIGVNDLDLTQYANWDVPLSCSENDAGAMFDIARNAGFKAELMLTSNAKAADAIAKIDSAAGTLASGDIFFLSFAGHGTTVPASAITQKAQAAWLLYDRMVLRSELDQVLSRFRPGVRLLLVSDSCDSGGVLSPAQIATLSQKLKTPNFTLMSMPSEVASKLVRTISPSSATLPITSPETRVVFRASTIFLASSKANENSVEVKGATYSLFTQTMLNIWNNGQFGRNYHDLYLAIRKVLFEQQDPSFQMRGPANQAFKNQKPFTI